MENVLYEKKDHVGLITISRPNALNALNYDVLEELNAVVDLIAEDDGVYCAVLTGAGEKAFVAGADIAALKDMGVLEARKFSQAGHALYRKIELLEKPLIAAVNGYALGAGCELALSCDIRIASQNAAFGLPEVNLGITTGWGGSQRLSRLVGVSTAKWMIYTGEAKKSDEALSIGLVSKVVPLESLMEEAMALAQKLAAKAPIALKYAKTAINRGLYCDLDTALSYEAEVFSQCFATEDAKEAMQAFIEKRKVENFKNR